MSGIEVVLPVVGPILSRRALKAGSCVTFYGQNIDQHRVTFYPCSAPYSGQNIDRALEERRKKATPRDTLLAP